MDKLNTGTADALKVGKHEKESQKRTVTVSAKVTLVQREEIKSLVKELGLKDVSELVTLALSEFLKRYEKPLARHVDASLTDELIKKRLMACPIYRMLCTGGSLAVDGGSEATGLRSKVGR